MGRTNFEDKQKLNYTWPSCRSTANFLFKERKAVDIHKFYLQKKNKECVWTGQRHKNNFEIDHVIPFSLWRNNDLWNLLPCSVKTNRNKKDKLPAGNLFTKRKYALAHYWILNNSFNQKRFLYEINNFVGKIITDNFWALPFFII